MVPCLNSYPLDNVFFSPSKGEHMWKLQRGLAFLDIFFVFEGGRVSKDLHVFSAFTLRSLCRSLPPTPPPNPPPPPRSEAQIPNDEVFSHENKWWLTIYPLVIKLTVGPWNWPIYRGLTSLSTSMTGRVYVCLSLFGWCQSVMKNDPRKPSTIYRKPYMWGKNLWFPVEFSHKPSDVP